MDTSHLLSGQRRPQSNRSPIQRIDGRCGRVRASTHRWLDEAPTSKGACLRLTFPTPVPPLPAAALRLPNMRRAGKSKPVVWRWEARFMAEGATGSPATRRASPARNRFPRPVDLTLGPPPGDATHWTFRMLAKAAGVSLRSVQRILAAHRLAPHRSHPQAVDRPEIRGEAQGHCWSLRCPCGV
jgi:hypothetical protein